MQVILLAAGKGMRLGEKTAAIPKTLLSIGGKPLCLHILDSLGSFNSNRIVVVGGFECEKLSRVLSRSDKAIHLIKNDKFEKGNLLTLLCAQKEIDQSFYIMNADHLYSHAIYKKVFELNRSSFITAVCDFDRRLTDDDMKIRLKEDRSLEEMDKKLGSYDGGYIGITYVPVGKSSVYWDAARTVLAREGEMVSVEAVLNHLINLGEKISILDVSGSHWFEVDTPEDLERAEELIYKMDF